MSDEINIDQINQLSETIDQLKASLADTAGADAAKRILGDLSNTIAHMKTAAMGAAGAVSDFTKELNLDSVAKAAQSGIEGVKTKIMELQMQANMTVKEMEMMAIKLASFYLLASGRLAISNELAGASAEAKGFSASLAMSTDKVISLFAAQGKLSGTLGGIANAARTVFAQTDIIKDFETSILTTAASAGDLQAALETTGEDFSGLADITAKYSAMLKEVGNANNLSAGQTAKYADQLKQIPGMLDQMVEKTGSAGTETLMLDATIKVANGTFQKFGDVMQDLTMLYRNWGVTQNEALSLVARMSSVAQGLKMPMDLMRDYVKGVGEQFKFLGDNTQSAIDIMAGMSTALKDSGLGPGAIAQLVKNMTQGIAQMDVAQRAFMSAQSGGPGGLQGAYKISLALQQGNMNDVMAQAEQTIRGMFGGEVVTLEQAANDARSAAQFTKQVQMLTTGPMKIAGSEQEAFRILEAFSKGTIPEMTSKATIKTPEEAWRLMAAYIGHWQLQGYGYMAIEEKSSGKFVGCVGLWNSDPWPEMEMGYWLITEMQGKGYATEAAQKIMEFAFHTIQAPSLVSYISPQNMASRRLAERLGAVHEETIELLEFGPHHVYRYQGNE